jgi:hypothetical protein
VRSYNVGGKVIKEHWEIHPVEIVVSIDNKPPFQIGPSAKYVSSTGLTGRELAQKLFVQITAEMIR